MGAFVTKKKPEGRGGGTNHASRVGRGRRRNANRCGCVLAVGSAEPWKEGEACTLRITTGSRGDRPNPARGTNATAVGYCCH